jgi:hypothetical protein
VFDEPVPAAPPVTATRVSPQSVHFDGVAVQGAAGVRVYLGPSASFPRWTAWISSGWLDGKTSYDLPDLGLVPGFSPDWAIDGDDGLFQLTGYVISSTTPTFVELRNLRGSLHAMPDGTRVRVVATSGAVAPL